jgi:hypothetical protein
MLTFIKYNLIFSDLYNTPIQNTYNFIRHIELSLRFWRNKRIFIINWIKRFIFINNKKHSIEMVVKEIGEFIRSADINQSINNHTCHEELDKRIRTQ